MLSGLEVVFQNSSNLEKAWLKFVYINGLYYPLRVLAPHLTINKGPVSRKKESSRLSHSTKNGTVLRTKKNDRLLRSLKICSKILRKEENARLLLSLENDTTIVGREKNEGNMRPQFRGERRTKGCKRDQGMKCTKKGCPRLEGKARNAQEIQTGPRKRAPLDVLSKD